MINIENRFKRWLKGEGPRPPLGTWLMAAAPSTAEALGYTGFDFLVVDMEHVPIEVSDLAAILRAIGCTPADAVVRLPGTIRLSSSARSMRERRPSCCRSYRRPRAARQAVVSAKYPPEGSRGVAAVHRGSRFGRATDYLKRANDEVAVIVQLETPEAVERLPEIAAVRGVDALFVGPGDLAAAMGHIGDIAHPEVQALIAKAAGHGKDSRKSGGHCWPQSRHGAAVYRVWL